MAITPGGSTNAYLESVHSQPLWPKSPGSGSCVFSRTMSQEGIPALVLDVSTLNYSQINARLPVNLDI